MIKNWKQIKINLKLKKQLKTTTLNKKTMNLNNKLFFIVNKVIMMNRMKEVRF